MKNMSQHKKKHENKWKKANQNPYKFHEIPKALTWFQGLAKLLVFLRFLQHLHFILPQASVVFSRGRFCETSWNINN